MSAIEKIIGLVVSVYLIAYAVPGALVALGTANLSGPVNSTGAGTAVTSLWGIIGIIVVIGLVKMMISKNKDD